jgi:hypothetical protein
MGITRDVLDVLRILMIEFLSSSGIEILSIRDLLRGFLFFSRNVISG